MRRDKLEETFQLPWSKQDIVRTVGCCICLYTMHFLFSYPKVTPEDAIPHTPFPLCIIKERRNMNWSIVLNMCRKSIQCQSQGCVLGSRRCVWCSSVHTDVFLKRYIQVLLSCPWTTFLWMFPLILFSAAYCAKF
jgi:hypothetical protein